MLAPPLFYQPYNSHVWDLAPRRGSLQGEVSHTQGVLCPAAQLVPSPTTRHAGGEH